MHIAKIWKWNSDIQYVLIEQGNEIIVFSHDSVGNIVGVKFNRCCAGHVGITFSNADDPLQNFLPRYCSHVLLDNGIKVEKCNVENNATQLVYLHQTHPVSAHRTCAFRSEQADPTKIEELAKPTKQQI